MILSSQTQRRFGSVGVGPSVLRRRAPGRGFELVVAERLDGQRRIANELRCRREVVVGHGRSVHELHFDHG
jgi:hypothetical protein